MALYTHPMEDVAKHRQAVQAAADLAAEPYAASFIAGLHARLEGLRSEWHAAESPHAAAVLQGRSAELSELITHIENAREAINKRR